MGCGMEKMELTVSAEKLSDVGLFGSVHAATIAPKEAPIYLNVDTGTDWVAVFSAVMSLVVALLVAWLTVGVQRNQIRANISNFRNQWMAELRGCGAELVKILAHIINAVSSAPSYRQSHLWTEQYLRALQLRSQLDLLLSRNDDRSYAIRKSCATLLEMINKQEGDKEKTVLVDSLVEFQALLRTELESAWEDTKEDLGLNRSFLGFRFARRRRQSAK